ncbi:hypothetical protein [Acinetobacter shaoyimingii]|uniref:DUF1190 domain-containing protein n=1 Tax=Acinetobacter shaoyimingii TaxID=2715164 RepID=A0A6G8RR70_9GAMM|nr:hypothetical protein [Acinetobacter shaoyimingii]QIO04469.1 hypothetical protein G8E00_00095 [Acinetobacter shaoyimingii]
MRTKKISLVVVPILLSACSGQKTLQQDVYNNQYDCAMDWQTDLCETEDDENGSSSSSHGGYYVGRYLGPQYYQGNRKVKYLGRVFEPTSNRSVTQPRVSVRAYNGKTYSPIRGGFGRSGGSFGG